MFRLRHLSFFLALCPFLSDQVPGSPNVVFVIVDDLNGLPLHPDGMPLAPTPHIDRLARRGVSFTNAHCNDPICAPSRATLMFGLYPQTSGLYWFENWRQNDILNRCVSLNQHLRQNGYSVYGTGKIYHGGAGNPKHFDDYDLRTSFGPWPWDGRKETARGYFPHPDQKYLLDGDPDIPFQWEHHFGPLSKIPHWQADPETGAPGYRGWRLFGKPWKHGVDGERDLMPDELYARFSREILSGDHQKPFALFTGLVRTHTPLYAPQEYYDRFPLDSIEFPVTLRGDRDDCAAALVDPRLYGFRRYKMLSKHSDKPLLKQWIQAYLACVSFVDDQVGVILDAVEASPARDNTIVILTSDHGFHMGDKEFLYKQSLWDGATRVPLIVAGVEDMPEGAVCHHPVSLVDIYPTLIDLCDLPEAPNQFGNGYTLEGHSLRPFLMNPESGRWTGPDAAITALPGKDHMHLNQHDGTWYPHFSIRTKDWRYTLCASGEEELYDFRNDPHEWHNLANDPKHTKTKSELREKLIALRDGDRWRPLEDLQSWTYGTYKGGATQSKAGLRFVGGDSLRLSAKGSMKNFEWEGEWKTQQMNDLRFSYHARVQDDELAGVLASIPKSGEEAKQKGIDFRPNDWNRYRIRVTGKRCQVWVNHRVYSDTLGKVGEGRLGIDFPDADHATIELRNVRIREL